MLDTNVASFLLTSRPEAKLYARDVRDRRTTVAFQTAAELLAGADFRGRGARRRRGLSRFLGDLDVLYPDRETVGTWGHLRASMLTQGVAVITADLWIAAIAITRDMTLIAHDAVFRRVPGLRLVCHLP